VGLKRVRDASQRKGKRETSTLKASAPTYTSSA
jgi:hypothetical protein